VPQPLLIAVFRAFPSSRAVVPSRGHVLPCRCPPACCDAPTSALSPAVSRTPTLRRARWPRSPAGYGSPFHERGARFLVALDRDRRNRPVPPASPTSEPCSRFESVRAGPSHPECGGRCPLDLSPLQSPSHEPRSLLPARPRGPDTARSRRASPQARTRGSEDQQPSESGVVLVVHAR